MSRNRGLRLTNVLGIEGVTRRRFRTGTTKRDADATPAPDCPSPPLEKREKKPYHTPKPKKLAVREKRGSPQDVRMESFEKVYEFASVAEPLHHPPPSSTTTRSADLTTSSRCEITTVVRPLITSA